jgi:hypothetical protein
VRVIKVQNIEMFRFAPPHPNRSAERSTELTPKSHDEALSRKGREGFRVDSK